MFPSASDLHLPSDRDENLKFPASIHHHQEVREQLSTADFSSMGKCIFLLALIQSPLHLVAVDSTKWESHFW